MALAHLLCTEALGQDLDKVSYDAAGALYDASISRYFAHLRIGAFCDGEEHPTIHCIVGCLWPSYDAVIL